MIRYALDATVLLRWFTLSKEVDTAKALRLRQEHMSETIELIILDQSLYELIDCLKENAQYSPDLISQALDSLTYMHITLVSYEPAIAKKAAQIAWEHDISIYAAGPIALGAQLRCQTVTCDEALYRKVATLPWTALLSRLNF
jgi:predicted nucleic acid-binding protein